MAHKIREVYIVHHSHTDVGYTDLQEQVIYNQANNIRRAVELIEEGLEKGTNQKDLKWNCETWYCVEQFLKAATKEEKKTFFDLVKKNSIGLSANYLNFNDLADCEYLTEKIHDMQEVCAKEGITVKTAMFADINGISMGQRDAMLANGVEFLYTNRFLDRLRLLFHLSEVVHRLIPKLRCIPEGQFVLIPHVVDLILHGLLQLFLLGI